MTRTEKAQAAARIDPLIAISDPEILARLCKIIGPERVQRWTPWPHQIELWRSARQHRRLINLKARQLGISWAMALYALWFAMAHPAVNVLVVSIGEREAQKFLRKVIFLYNSLPAEIREAFPLAKKPTEEEFQIQHALGISYISSLPSSAAAGRGDTVALLIADEGAHWPRPDEQFASLFPTIGDVGRLILASTANGLNDFYDRWVKADERGWGRLFFGALGRPDRNDEWVARERAELGDRGPQEYPLTPGEAFIASGGMAFPMNVLQDYLDNSVEDPHWKGVIERDAAMLRTRRDPAGNWVAWDIPDPTRDYAIVADVCGGMSGRDYSYATVIDLISLDQVAAYHSRVEPGEFSRELVRAGYLWSGASGPALLVPENNGHGAAVIALLAEWMYPRVYQEEVFDQREQRRKRRFGFNTSWQSRPLLVGALQECLRNGVLGIRDAHAIAEMSRFQEVESGGSTRYEAAKGNDDRVMAWGIAALVCTQSRQARASANRLRAVDPNDHKPYRS